MKKPIDQRLRINAAGVIATLALTLVGYLLGVEPGLDDRTIQQRRLSSLQAREQEVRIAEADLFAATFRKQTLVSQVNALPFELEDPAAVNDRLVRVARLADDARVVVQQVSPGKPEYGERFTAVPIRLVGESTYATLVQFLRGLRAEMPDVGVSELKLTGVPTDSVGKASFSISCVWYAASAVSNASVTTEGRSIP